MNREVIFSRLGLPKHTSAVYQQLSKHGPNSPTDICRATRLHRPAVYRALIALQKHHFVYTTQRGARTLYHASSGRIVAKTFAQTVANVAERFAVHAVAEEQYKRKEIRFLSGFAGVRAAFDDVIDHLHYGETFFRYTSERDLQKVNAYLSPKYRQRRDAKRLERLVISNPVSGSQKKPRLERFIKFIPTKESLFNQNIIQLVYGKRVSFIDLNTERVLVIENAVFAEFQKVIFRQLYSKLPFSA
jgi:sugar-specific transcriptional regulator TrmB